MPLSQESEIIDDVVLVVGEGQEDYVYDQIVRKYHFYKVKAIVKGGEERYASVWQGLRVIKTALFQEYIPAVIFSSMTEPDPSLMKEYLSVPMKRWISIKPVWRECQAKIRLSWRMKMDLPV